MTGKCPHGFASSQGTCQTNNVHKHKKDRRRERGKWERSRGRRGPDQNHLCGSRQRGREDAGSGEEEKPFFLSSNKNWKWKPASCSCSLIICRSGLWLRVIHSTDVTWVHSERQALGLPKVNELRAWPAGSPAMRRDGRCHDSFRWAAGWCQKRRTFQLTEHTLHSGRPPAQDRPALLGPLPCPPLSFEGPFLMLRASSFTGEETEGQKDKMTSLR